MTESLTSSKFNVKIWTTIFCLYSFTKCLLSIKKKNRLARNLTLFQLLDKAGEPFNGKKSGEMLLIFVKDAHNFWEPGAIEFHPREEKTGMPGFWMREGNRGGSTLENSAVVFNYRNKAIIFVEPGPNNEEVSGVRINAQLRATDFSGPREVFERIILDAKDKATKALKPN